MKLGTLVYVSNKERIGYGKFGKVVCIEPWFVGVEHEGGKVAIYLASDLKEMSPQRDVDLC